MFPVSQGARCPQTDRLFSMKPSPITTTVTLPGCLGTCPGDGSPVYSAIFRTKGGISVEKDFLSLPLPTLLSLPQRSTSRRPHGPPCICQSLLLFIWERAGVSRERQRCLSSHTPTLPHSQGGLSQTRAREVNTVCRCGMSALLHSAPWPVGLGGVAVYDTADLSLSISVQAWTHKAVPRQS